MLYRVTIQWSDANPDPDLICEVHRDVGDVLESYVGPAPDDGRLVHFAMQAMAATFPQLPF